VFITDFYDSEEFNVTKRDDSVFITKLYSDLLGRKNTATELSSGLSALENGLSRSQLALSIMTSPEFVSASQWA
jgi:hypothetical protein